MEFVKRAFMPGSEWLYLKIYTGHKSADRLLSGKIKKMVRRLEEEGIIRRFFFIRYSDPDFHIRLRFLVRDTMDYGPVFCLFYSLFEEEMANGSVCKVMCDTYVRELERYGAATMELSEEFFHADSQAVLDLLERFGREGTSDEHRWLLSLNLADDILSGYGMELTARRDFMKSLADDFKREHGFLEGKLVNHGYQGQLDGKFRRKRKEIEEALGCWDTEGNDYREILDTRLAEIRPLLRKIRQVREEEGSLPEMEGHLRSLIHMTMNRFFRAKNRLYELVMYDFLYRYYRSGAARKEAAVKKPDK